MKRYCLEIAYDGTNYHGWQKQTNAISVQEVLEKHLSMICREEISVTGCGRTDTGVHARQFFLHFDSTNELSSDLWFRLNAVLPDDIVSYGMKETSDDFSSRFDAKEREYQYYIQTTRNPFNRDYVWYLHQDLDLGKMNEACAYLLGKQDFTSFSKAHTQTHTNNCDVKYAEWTEDNGVLVFTIRADRFLRNMVRAIVGTLVEVGLGKMKPNDVKTVINKKDRAEAGKSVPAKGLFLTKVVY